MKTAELKYQTPLQDRYPFRETHRFDETATVTLRNPLPPPKRTVFLKISLETAELQDLPPRAHTNPFSRSPLWTPDASRNYSGILRSGKTLRPVLIHQN